MGLFDSIHCEIDLPDGCPERDFQSKSMGSLLDSFRLVAPGRLLHASGENAGEDAAVHGVIRMYTSDAERRWWEYELKFTDGLLVHLLPKDQAHYPIDGAARAAPRRQESP